MSVEWKSFSRISRIYSPIPYLGRLRRRKYFEGWYFKHVSRDRKAALAVIPGVSFSETGRHCFVQLIDGASGKSRWFPYPLSDFAFSRRSFEISIGPNRFSLRGIELHLSDHDGPVEAHLEYHDPTPLAPRLLWPNVMGPYSFAPLMECYHAIGSMDHGITGSARIGAMTMDFTGGAGYLEKDWGTSMPSAWIWAQSNTFEEMGASFVFSLARVPWLRSSFPGFFALLRSGGVVRRFASYTGAVVKRVSIDGRELEIEVEDRELRLKLRARRSRHGALLAPVQGAMDRRIGESIDARLWVRLEDKEGEILFEGTAVSAGLEVVGDVSSLTPVRLRDE